ncbi:hypothetical protein JX265_010670 [Neoarthrinium moseri]|uniref:RGS domain-containing protein n=1 Tax=Neoarthrinium moseri TaxID=1658444 RepID=A0A9P9WDP1_9PEZI|nr:uncharacterized protein JN550_007183 [Neoarthrinium moseri]KAI1858577.1 hypothetical protein JX265_010670 [Neoarthrinium moseri]KAI1867131.1 hypothetical protein JN550_007183 [Neoarthrinium moseri]
MSLLFYRRPDYLSRSRNRPELAESLCASYLEVAEATKSKIPTNLSFEEIVKNNTLPPCSLNDFMDYLMYVEYNAECLQFFLWYCDYVERWSKLPQEERDSSPMIPSNKGAVNRRKHARTNSYTEKTERFNRILAILEKSPKHDSTVSKPVGRKSRRNDSVSTNYSWPRPTSSSGASHSSSDSSRHSSASSKTQPFRDEISRVVRHYISTGGPRQLNLTHQDRTACIDAVHQTTHPSALLPAFAAAEAILRGQCHPNFIKWSIANSNRPRVVFVRGLAATLILLGFVLDALLVLSGLNPLLRLTAAPLWCAGLSFLIASRHGLCIILHCNYKRNLRPWEQFSDDDVGSVSDMDEKAEALEDDSKEDVHRHKRTGTNLSVGSSRTDPLRKQSLQSFGAPNTFDAEPWVGLYHEKPLWKRVFDVSVMTQNKHLRAIQDRIVFKAILGGSFLALAMAAGSIFIPSADLF